VTENAPGSEPTPPPDDTPEQKQLADFLQASASQGDGLARPAALDDQIARLQDRVAETENKLHEERFMWVLVLVVVFDVAFILHADNWASPLVIGVLQFIGLVVFASRCRVDPIMPLLDKVAGMLPNGKSHT
jgi:hypothetical protein